MNAWEDVKSTAGHLTYLGTCIAPNVMGRRPRLEGGTYPGQVNLNIYVCI